MKKGSDIRTRRSSLPWHMLPVILTLAWPTMLEQLMQTAVQYIDTAKSRHGCHRRCRCNNDGQLADRKHDIRACRRIFGIYIASRGRGQTH